MENRVKNSIKNYMYDKVTNFIERATITTDDGTDYYGAIRHMNYYNEDKRIQMQAEFQKNPKNVRLMKTVNKVFYYNKFDFKYGENTAVYQNMWFDCDIPLAQHDIYRLKRNMDDIISLSKDGESLVGLATREVSPDDQTYKSHFNIMFKPQKVLHSGSSFVKMLSTTYSYFNNCFVPEFSKEIGKNGNTNVEKETVKLKSILKKLEDLTSQKAVEVQGVDDDLFKVLMMFSDEMHSCAQNIVYKKIIQKSKMIEKLIIACKNSIAMKACPESFDHSIFDEKITNQANHMLNVHDELGCRGYKTSETAKEIDLYDLVVSVLTPQEIISVVRSYDYSNHNREDYDTYTINNIFEDIEKRKFLTMSENIAYYIGSPFRHKPVIADSQDNPFSGKLFLNQKALKEISLSCWKKGHRHNLSLKLAGTFVRMGISEDHALQFIEDICYEMNDEEREDRLKCVEDTYSRFLSGGSVYGFPSLKAHFVHILSKNKGYRNRATKHLELLEETSNSTERVDTYKASPICYSKTRLINGDLSNYPFIDFDDVTSPKSLYKRLHQYTIIMSYILYRCYTTVERRTAWTLASDYILQFESTNDDFATNLVDKLYHESEYESLASFKTIVNSMVKILTEFRMIEIQKSKIIRKDENGKAIRVYTIQLNYDGEKFLKTHPVHMVHMSSSVKEFVPVYLGIYDYIYRYNTELKKPTLISTSKVGKSFTVCLERTYDLHQRRRSYADETKQQFPYITEENRYSFDFLPEHKQIENFFFKVYQLHRTMNVNDTTIDQNEYNSILEEIAKAMDDCNNYAHGILSYESLCMFIKCMALADCKTNKVIPKSLSGRLFNIDKKNAIYYGQATQLYNNVVYNTTQFENDQEYNKLKTKVLSLYSEDPEFKKSCDVRLLRETDFLAAAKLIGIDLTIKESKKNRYNEDVIQRDRRIRKELIEREQKFKK